MLLLLLVVSSLATAASASSAPTSPAAAPRLKIGKGQRVVATVVSSGRGRADSVGDVAEIPVRALNGVSGGVPTGNCHLGNIVLWRQVLAETSGEVTLRQLAASGCELAALLLGIGKILVEGFGL